MSVRIASAASDALNFGRGAGLDSQAAGTILMWIKPANVDTSVGQRRYASKYDGSSAGWEFGTISALGAGAIRLRPRATSGTWRQDSATGVITTGEWQFLAGAWSIGGGQPAPDLWRGTIASAPVSINSSSATGGTTVSNDSAIDVGIGNRIGSSESADADIAFCALYNVRMALADVVAQWRRPRPVSGCLFHAWPGLHGTVTAIDLSGTRRNASVAGSPTWAAMPPLPLPLRLAG